MNKRLLKTTIYAFTITCLVMNLHDANTTEVNDKVVDGSLSAVEFQDPMTAGLANSEADTAGCCVIGGDTDNDGELTIFDGAYLINFTFLNYPPPDCLEQADADGSGDLSIVDLVYMVKYVFINGPAPVCPSTSP